MTDVSEKLTLQEGIRAGLLLASNVLFFCFYGDSPLRGYSLVCVLVVSFLAWLGGLLATHGTHPSRPVFLIIVLILCIWLAQKGSGIFFLGISFYSLHAIGYLLDIKDGSYPAEANPLWLLIFLTFFPIAVQGPVCRYADFRKQLKSWLRGENHLENGRHGSLGRILWGCFQKLVVANRLSLLTTALFASPESYQGGYVLLALCVYTIQLYADFAGGISITLGVARCLGFSLPENFDHPFRAGTLAEYWRRWHISLGTWFRDYVFYPLCFIGWGGASLSLCLSTLATWCLTGLWHGLAPRFLLWGLLNGVFLLCSEYHSRFRKRKGKTTSIPTFFGLIRVFLLTSLLRSLDCYSSIRIAASQVFSIVTEIPHGWGLTICNSIFPSLPGLKTADYWLLVILFLLYRITRKAFCHRWQTIEAVSPSVNPTFWQQAELFCNTGKGYFLYCTGCVLLLATILLFGIYGQGYDASGFIYGNFI